MWPPDSVFLSSMSDSSFSNNTIKPLRIPTPPRFSDFTFSTIGQQPNLLKRMMSPVVPEEFVEDSPESPSSEVTQEPVVNEFRSRPSLLDVLAGDDVAMKELDGDSGREEETMAMSQTNKTTAPRAETSGASQNSRVSPLPLSTSVSVLQLNSPSTFLTPSMSSNSLPEAKMAYRRSQDPQSSRPSSMSNDIIGESSVLPDDEPPTLVSLHALLAKVAASLRNLSPVDNSEALTLSKSLKGQCSVVLTTAQRTHDLAKRAFAAAQESVNVAQECLAAADSIQLSVCEVFEAIHKIGPGADTSGPASHWNSSLQTVKVQLDHIDQWVNRKEAYDAMQKEKSVLESVAMQKQETGIRSTSRISPSPPTDGTEPSGTSAEQESAEREWREKVAERQRLAEEDLRRRREDEELLEREVQDAQQEAEARASKLALLKAERQRAEEEEKRKQEHEARETEERELTARQSCRARLGHQKQESDRTPDSQKATLLEHDKKQKALDDKRRQANIEGVGQRQNESEAPRRQENEAKKLRQVEVEPATCPLAEAAKGDTTVLLQTQVETPKRRDAEIETEERRDAEAAPAMLQATVDPKQRRQSEAAQRREAGTEAGRGQAAVVEKARVDVDIEIARAKKRQVETEAAKHRQVEASEATGQHAETVRQQQGEAEACRGQVKIEAAKSYQPDINDLRNQGAMELQKLDVPKEQHSPRFPTTTLVDGNTRSRRRSSSAGPTPTSPMANNLNVIGNITSRKTLADRYKPSLLSPKEKKHQISTEQVTSPQRGTSDLFTARDIHGTVTGYLLPATSIVDGSVRQQNSFNTGPISDSEVLHLTKPPDKELRPVELQALSESLVSLPQATSISPPPNDTGTLGNVILLRSKLIPSSPVVQKVCRDMNGLPNPLFIKAEPVARKADTKIHKYDAAIPSALKTAASSEGVSLTSKPTAAQNKEIFDQAKPPTLTVATQSSLDVAVPEAKLSEDSVPFSDARAQMCKPSVAAIPFPVLPVSSTPVIPNMPRHSPSPVNIARHTTVTPIAGAKLQTPPACIAGFFSQFQQDTTESHVTVHPHAEKIVVATIHSRPLSRTADASATLQGSQSRVKSHTPQIVTVEDERRHLSKSSAVTTLPKRPQSSPPPPDRVPFQPSMRPKSYVHDPFDSRMGPDLMTPSAWDGGRDDVYHHRRLPTRHQHDRYTPSPTPLPKLRQRSPHSTEIVPRNGYYHYPPSHRDREPPPHMGGRATMSRSREISPCRPFGPPDPDHVRYDLHDQRAPLVGRKRSRDEDRTPGPPPRRPRRSDNRQYSLPAQRIPSSSIAAPSILPIKPSASTQPELASLAMRMDASRSTDEDPNLGDGQARALMQRMDHPTEPTSHVREQHSPHRHSPLHPVNNHSPSNTQPDLLNRISDPRYPDHHMSGYHRYNNSNPNRRSVNRSRPPRSGGRGRGSFQNHSHSQALIHRLQAPSEYSEN